MKNLIFVVAMLLLTSGYVISQHTLNGSTNLSVAGSQIVKIGTSSYDYGVYAIGRETVQGNTRVYRTFFDLSFSSIPTNATITQATVSYSNGKTGYSLKLTQLSTVSPSDLSANWNAIANGSSLHTGLPYSGQNFNSTSIKTAIQNNLSGRRLIIGALSESESTDGSATSMTFSIYVTYTYPAAALTVQARNDLEGANGGNIGAAKYPTTASSHSSPYTIPSIYETDQINLAAYDNQVVSNVTWLFNDTEAPANQSKWQKELYGTNTNLGANASFTTSSLTSNDNGASFVAYLKKICNVTFQNSLPENGGNIGDVTIDGATYNVTKIYGKVKANTVTFSAGNNEPVVNGIMSVFDHWSDGNTSWQRTETINSDASYICYYKGKPSTSSRGL